MARPRKHPEGTTLADLQRSSREARASAGGRQISAVIGKEAAAALVALQGKGETVRAVIERVLLEAAERITPPLHRAGGKLPALAPSLIEAMREARRRGSRLEQIAEDFRVSKSAVGRYTEGIPVPTRAPERWRVKAPPAWLPEAHSRLASGERRAEAARSMGIPKSVFYRMVERFPASETTVREPLEPLK